MDILDENIEQYQYDPHLLECEACVQLDEKIEDLKQFIELCKDAIPHLINEGSTYVKMTAENYSRIEHFQNKNEGYKEMIRVAKKVLRDFYLYGSDHGIYKYCMVSVCRQFHEDRLKIMKKYEEDLDTHKKLNAEICVGEIKYKQLLAQKDVHIKMLKTSKKIAKSNKWKLKKFKKTFSYDIKKLIQEFKRKVGKNDLPEIICCLKKLEYEIVMELQEIDEGSDMDVDENPKHITSINTSPIRCNRLLPSPYLEKDNTDTNSVVVYHNNTADEDSNLNLENDDSDDSDLESVPILPEDYKIHSEKSKEVFNLEVYDVQASESSCDIEPIQQSENDECHAGKEPILHSRNDDCHAGKEPIHHSRNDDYHSGKEPIHHSRNDDCHAVLQSSQNIQSLEPEFVGERSVVQPSENQNLRWTDMDLGEDISDDMLNQPVEDYSHSEDEEDDVFSLTYLQKNRWLEFSKSMITPMSPDIPIVSSNITTSPEDIVSDLQTDSNLEHITVMTQTCMKTESRGTSTDVHISYEIASLCNIPIDESNQQQNGHNTDIFSDVRGLCSNSDAVYDDSFDESNEEEESYENSDGSEKSVPIESRKNLDKASVSNTALNIKTNSHSNDLLVALKEQLVKFVDGSKTDVFLDVYGNEILNEQVMSYLRSNSDAVYDVLLDESNNKEESYESSDGSEKSVPIETSRKNFDNENVSHVSLSIETDSHSTDMSLALKEQLVKMIDSSKSTKNTDIIKDIVTHYHQIGFSETHIRQIIEAKEKFNRANKIGNHLTYHETPATKSLTRFDYEIDKRVENVESFAFNKVKSSKTYLEPREYIKRRLNKRRETSFPKESPKKRRLDISLSEKFPKRRCIESSLTVVNSSDNSVPPAIVTSANSDKNVSCVDSYTQYQIEDFQNDESLQKVAGLSDKSLQNVAGPSSYRCYMGNPSDNKYKVASSRCGNFSEIKTEHSTGKKIPKSETVKEFNADSASETDAPQLKETQKSRQLSHSNHQVEPELQTDDELDYEPFDSPECEIFSDEPKNEHHNISLDSETSYDSSVNVNVINEDSLSSENISSIPLKTEKFSIQDSRNADLQSFENNVAEQKFSDVDKKISLPFRFYTSAVNRDEYDVDVSGIENTAENSALSNYDKRHDFSCSNTADTPTKNVVDVVNDSILWDIPSFDTVPETSEISQENKDVLRRIMERYEKKIQRKARCVAYDFKILNDVNTMFVYLRELENLLPNEVLMSPGFLKIDRYVLIACTILRLEKSYNSVIWSRLVELYTTYFQQHIVYILYSIQHRIFLLKTEFPYDYIVINLTNFYVKVCLKTGDYSRIEKFAVDSFYCLKSNACIVVKEILKLYPLLFPMGANFRKDKSLLIFVLLDTLFHIGNRWSSHSEELLKILRRKYNYKWEKQTNHEVATALLTNLKSNCLFQLEPSIIIFSRRISWRRSIFYMLQRGLFPIVDNWLRGNSELSEEAVALSVRSLAYISRLFPINGKEALAEKGIQTVSKKLMRLVKVRNMPEIVKKSLYYALFCHGHEDFRNTLTSILNLGLKDMDEELLEVFMYYRGRPFWYENFPFLKGEC